MAANEQQTQQSEQKNHKNYDCNHCGFYFVLFSQFSFRCHFYIQKGGYFQTKPHRFGNSSPVSQSLFYKQYHKSFHIFSWRNKVSQNSTAESKIYMNMTFIFFCIVRKSLKKNLHHSGFHSLDRRKTTVCIIPDVFTTNEINVLHIFFYFDICLYFLKKY